MNATDTLKRKRIGFTRDRRGWMITDYRTGFIVLFAIPSPLHRRLWRSTATEAVEPPRWKRVIREVQFLWAFSVCWSFRPGTKVRAEKAVQWRKAFRKGKV